MVECRRGLDLDKFRWVIDLCVSRVGDALHGHIKDPRIKYDVPDKAQEAIRNLSAVLLTEGYREALRQMQEHVFTSGLDYPLPFEQWVKTPDEN